MQSLEELDFRKDTPASVFSPQVVSWARCAAVITLTQWCCSADSLP